ncbi:DUF4266 domain-containing protein [Aquabacterium sp.]|uniref:DUF4266 domain-containing protein n=1 Tax=Aquabacterium sp. TaxID=1872578 RepID=UPI002D0E7DA8|nr:DUF4266 domain-containing protein [Aquabacterium sp.]HSW07948.1 DUF4266 domain-containing protein [Aquabacterium sp.]
MALMRVRRQGRGRSGAVLGLAAAMLACGSGCALLQPVAPWQKGVLARPEMSFEADRLEAAVNNHVYSSKEAASGGNGVGGGGCGCN